MQQLTPAEIHRVAGGTTAAAKAPTAALAAAAAKTVIPSKP
jgi:hypothetical protein